ncbi:uncharacterized protein METZ01_LOCUS411682, partial [marine metagenome]
KFSLPRNLDMKTGTVSNLNIVYKLMGASEVRKAMVFPYPAYSKKLLEGGIPRVKPDFKKFDFLDIDLNNHLIIIKKGKWKLKQDLLIPRGFKVIFNSGVILDLINSSKILSYSPLEAMGTEELPIVITSSDGTGQGISVINAHEPSKFTHVIFKNLSSSSNGSWELTGSLNFYESPVEFYKCAFLDNKKGDDLLNIIRSKFVIGSSLFKRTFADALDVDFSSGEIVNTSFVRCGTLGKNGDGVDVSGSSIRVKSLIFDNIADKALSVGENSVVEGDD